MKKVLFFTLIAISVSFSTIAQTSYTALIKKIDAAPANEYGVKRVNYGQWNTTPGAQNIWATYNPKDRTYTLCFAVMGQAAFKEFVSVQSGKETNEQKILIEKTCSTLSLSNWNPVK